MEGLKDRLGRALKLRVSGRGKTAGVDAAALAALLRLRKRLAGDPALCRRAAEKKLGTVPERAELELWNGRRLLFEIPRDACSFFFDLHAVILKDQYDAGSCAIRGGTVVDAGANLGVFTLYALALGAAKVHAFEPVAETRALLEANLALNGAGRAVKVHAAALGRSAGAAFMKFNIKGEGSAMLERCSAGVNEGVAYSGRRRVSVAALDGLRLGRVDLIKIDAEGAEKEILLGASRLIRRYKPVLSFASYHRQSDKLDLPAVVRSIRPDYLIKHNSHAEDDIFCR